MVTLIMNYLSTGEIWLLAAIAIGLSAVISVGIYAWRQAHKTNRDVNHSH